MMIETIIHYGRKMEKSESYKKDKKLFAKCSKNQVNKNDNKAISIIMTEMLKQLKLI